MTTTTQPPRDPDDRSGYPEKQPDTVRQARHAGKPPKPDPDDGGLDRDPDDQPQPPTDSHSSTD